MKDHCEWCGEDDIILVEHHYPVMKQYGGTETVDICPNCHTRAHQGILIDATMAETEEEYQIRLNEAQGKAIEKYFPLLYQKLQSEEKGLPSPFEKVTTLTPPWMWKNDMPEEKKGEMTRALNSAREFMKENEGD